MSAKLTSETLIRWAKSHYPDRQERAALRCALGDAAHLCDAIAREIVADHTSRRKLTKHGAELEAIAKRCGDAIWAMREKIDFEPEPESTPVHGGAR